MSASLREIESCYFELSETWSSVPNVPRPGDWPAEVAALLAEEGKARGRLTKALRKSHPDLLDPQGIRLVIGVWVPDREAGVVGGVVFADVLGGDPETPASRAYYRSLVEPDRRTGLTVYGRQLEDVELPAGPTLVAREVISRRTGIRHVLQHNVICTVFPPDSCQALQVTASTPNMALAESLEIEIEKAMATLTLTFRQEPA